MRVIGVIAYYSIPVKYYVMLSCKNIEKDINETSNGRSIFKRNIGKRI